RRLFPARRDTGASRRRAASARAQQPCDTRRLRLEGGSIPDHEAPSSRADAGGEDESVPGCVTRPSAYARRLRADRSLPAAAAARCGDGALPALRALRPRLGRDVRPAVFDAVDDRSAAFLQSLLEPGDELLQLFPRPLQHRVDRCRVRPLLDALLCALDRAVVHLRQMYRGVRMRVDELDYDLPPGLIAQRPQARRDESRLLVYDRVSERVD